jgi:type I restriction enzyme R subunit
MFFYLQQMNPHFHPFNKHTPVQIYHRNLPHWRQPGATYFTTFRLADSIPHALLTQWNHERTAWLVANGVLESMNKEERAIAYSQIDASQRKNFERVNARRLFSELDKCQGSCIFTKTACRTILQESMLHFDGDRYWSGDCIIMPNHVHWIVQPMAAHSLETILQSVKRFSATQLTKLGLRKSGPLWQSESHDHIIRDREELLRIRKYIRQNPEKARLSTGQFSLHITDWLDD